MSVMAMFLSSRVWRLVEVEMWCGGVDGMSRFCLVMEVVVFMSRVAESTLKL